jgi:hypothetical protein
MQRREFFGIVGGAGVFACPVLWGHAIGKIYLARITAGPGAGQPALDLVRRTLDLDAQPSRVAATGAPGTVLYEWAERDLLVTLETRSGAEASVLFLGTAGKMTLRCA